VINGLVAIHAMAAVVMIGELLYSGLWLGRAVAHGDSGLTPFVLATMRWTSRTYAFPAILVNLLTGLTLLHFKRTPMAAATWLWAALLLYAVVTALWHGVLIPMRKRMAAAIGQPEPARAVPAKGDAVVDFGRLAREWLTVNALVVLMLFAIFALMVWRPVFF
jgi:uncharacterized membrane protein